MNMELDAAETAVRAAAETAPTQIGCGPHRPHDDLQMHMRMSPGTWPMLFSDAFRAGKAVVWYECPVCKVRFVFTREGVQVVHP